MSSNTVDIIIVETVRETQKAILAVLKTSLGDDTYWIPKAILRNLGTHSTVPKWYAKRQGII